VRRRAQRGFTLIEVMFAIAILAMAMTVVFSSNIIAARSTMHSRELTRATMMARCRLTEAEAWLATDRLPATDTVLEDPPTSCGGARGVRGGDGGVALGGLAGAMGMMTGGGASGGGGAPSGAPSPRDMAGTLLTTVYPTVKPLLEGAIRRLTVTVRWHEGQREHSFEVVEYVTNPGQTLPTAELLNALPGAAGGASTPTPDLGAPPILRSP
jgi:general secretion pathway protein I